jgi:hypothetical protein
MWIKKKSRLNPRGQHKRPTTDPIPPPALVEFERSLHQATSAEDENALPNVAVISANRNGRSDTFPCMKDHWHYAVYLLLCSKIADTGPV